MFDADEILKERKVVVLKEEKGVVILLNLVTFRFEVDRLGITHSAQSLHDAVEIANRLLKENRKCALCSDRMGESDYTARINDMIVPMHADCWDGLEKRMKSRRLN